jgi:predicted RNA-binding protein with PIN domain
LIRVFSAMGMHIIIDGYNLVRQSKELSRLDRTDIARGREALIERLAIYHRFKPHRMTVVFDGIGAPALSPGRDRIKGIEIVFSRDGQNADAVIGRMVRQEGAAALVVSSDLAVVRNAQACGAAVIESAEFEGRMAMAGALEAGEPTEESLRARRISTRKKGEGRRLSKRLRQNQRRTAKL